MKWLSRRKCIEKRGSVGKHLKIKLVGDKAWQSRLSINRSWKNDFKSFNILSNYVYRNLIVLTSLLKAQNHLVESLAPSLPKSKGLILRRDLTCIRRGGPRSFLTHGSSKLPHSPFCLTCQLSQMGQQLLWAPNCTKHWNCKTKHYKNAIKQILSGYLEDYTRSKDKNIRDILLTLIIF